MWPGFDPKIKRDLESIRVLTNLRHQTPTREWPLTYVEEHDALLVIREWPNGEITAYWMTEIRRGTGRAGA